jgi:putative transposase
MKLYREHGEAGLRDARPEAVHLEPANKLTPSETAQIIEISCSEPFVDVAPSQIVPTLMDQGQYVASVSTFYRTLKAHQLQTHRGRASRPQSFTEPARHEAFKINELWVWDITWMPSPIKGRWYYLYSFMDLFSRKIVGWDVFETQDAEHAAEVLVKARLSQGGLTQSLVLHSDNGTPMKGATMLAKMQELGVMPSLSRPGVSDDNAQIESFFKTLKYRPHYPAEGFESLEASRAWCASFMTWYNFEHKHSALAFCTPHQRHVGDDIELIQKRQELKAQHKKEHPHRWNHSEQRLWARPKSVALNPINPKKKEIKERNFST